MKLINLLVFVLLLIAPAASAESGGSYKVSFHKVPLELVTADYAAKSGKTVEIVKGVKAAVTIVTDGHLNLEEYLQLFEEELAKHNIALYPIGTSRLVATWIKPPKSPSRSTAPSNFSQTSYIERIKKRQAQLRARPGGESIPAFTLTDKEIEEHLRRINMQAIRAGKPPLPIQLTPEEDAQLVKEGVLTPAGNGPKNVRRAIGTNKSQQTEE